MLPLYIIDLMSSVTGLPQSGGQDGQTGEHSGAMASSDAPWLSVDWRRHQRWVHVDGRPVNVVEVGSGEPVVFVHGLGGNWTNWLEQLPVIGTGWRAIALDLPGFGHSPMPAAQISISGYAAAVTGAMDALGIPSATLVGNSMGGEISAELALASPERVSRMMLVSPAGVSTGSLQPRLPLIRRAHPTLQSVNGWICRNAEKLARRPRLRNAALSTVAAQPQRISATFTAEQLKGMGKPGFLPALEAVVSHSQTLSERLPQVGTPTLIVWGDKDPLIPVRDADVFARQIPGAHKIVWQDTGHVAMFERPAEFNALLEGFLSA